MSWLESLIAWSNETFMPFGSLGLFVVAFMESSFFPIPPDLLLIPMALINPHLALFYALVVTIGSVSGSVLGYFIGVKGGRPVLIKLAGKKRTQSVDNYFKKYGNWTIGIAGFTPIPYKLFTIAAGVFRHSLKKLLIVSVFSRGGRFFLEATIIALYGQAIVGFIENYFGLFTLGVVVLVIVVYIVYKKIKK